MSQKKAVLFNFWGVVTRSRPIAVFQQFEVSNKLPCGFLSKILSRRDGAMNSAERGKMMLSQMILELDTECVKDAQAQGLTLPADWTVQNLIDDLRDTQVDPAVMQMAVTLRRNGILTAVLANHWVDDHATDDGWAHLLSLLGGHFDHIVQSCHSGHRVPEPAMFNSALQCLGVPPQQALYLAEDEEGVKVAEGEGMKAILVQDLKDALHKMADFTEIQGTLVEDPPLSCNSDEVSHGYVTIKPGVRTHYVHMGSGPPVLLCHGFPEGWFSWRYQIPALAAAGFTVLALDMKGYGESTAPADIEEYTQEQLCKDVVTFMDKLALPRVTLVGHDWGGVLVWNMAKYHPERVRAVASLNTPLFPVDPTADPMEKLKAVPLFDYQIYFQSPGVAEAELEENLGRTFKIFFSGSNDTEGHPAINTTGVCDRGGLFVGLPEEIPRSSMITESDLQFYINQYKDAGFRRPLNWYRNVERNWRYACSRPRGKLMMPALMVTAGKDPVLLPVFSRGMENMIPKLTRGHIEECGHWTQMEKPAELNRILISWLQETHRTPGVTMPPKL